MLKESNKGSGVGRVDDVGNIYFKYVYSCAGSPIVLKISFCLFHEISLWDFLRRNTKKAK